jgi:hypothetical protein
LPESIDIIDFYKKMVMMEKIYSSEIKELAENIKNPLFQAIFNAIAHDSLKHSKLYEALITISKSPLPFISKEDLDLIREKVKEHISTEKRMIDVIDSQLDTEEDPRKKLLMEAILSDEIVHHKLLVKIEQIIGEAEALTEEKIWDMLWRDSPFHGTPGG